MLAFTVLAIITISILLTLKSLRRKRKAAGVKSWVISQDLDGKGTKHYVNQQIGLMCKPDVHERNQVVEFKSSSPEDKPFPSDIVQLAAEMMTTGATVGVLKYKNGKTFTFQATDPVMKKAFARVMLIMDQMRKHLVTDTVPACTGSFNKCKTCAVKQECTFITRKLKLAA